MVLGIRERTGRSVTPKTDKTSVKDSDAAQDRTCTARAVVRSGHRTTARAVKKN